MSLGLMYILRSALVAIKKEMDEKGMSFDEFLEHYEEAIEIVESQKVNA